MTTARPISCFWFQSRGLIAIHTAAHGAGNAGIDVLYRASGGSHRALLVSNDRRVAVIRMPAAPPFDLLVVPASGEASVHRFDAAAASAGQPAPAAVSARWHDGGLEVAWADKPTPGAEITAAYANGVWQPVRQWRSSLAAHEVKVRFRIANAGREDYQLVVEVVGPAANAPRSVTVHHIHKAFAEQHTIVLDPKTAVEGRIHTQFVLGKAVRMDKVYITSEPGTVIRAEAMAEGVTRPLADPAISFLGNRFEQLSLPPSVPSWTGPPSFSPLYGAAPAEMQHLMWGARPLLEAAEKAGLGGHRWTAAGLRHFMTAPILGRLFLEAMLRLDTGDVRALLGGTAGGSADLFTCWSMAPELFRMWPLHPAFKQLPPPPPSGELTASTWDLKPLVDRAVGGEPAVAELIAREGGMAVPYIARCAIAGAMLPRHWRRIGWLFATRTPPGHAMPMADAFDLVTQDVLAGLPEIFCRGAPLWQMADTWRTRREAVMSAHVPNPAQVQALAEQLRALLQALDAEVAAFGSRRPAGAISLADLRIECDPAKPLRGLETLLDAQRRSNPAAVVQADPAVQLVIEAMVTAEEAKMVREEDAKLGQVIGWLAALAGGGGIPDWPAQSVEPSHLERALDVAAGQLAQGRRLGAAHGAATVALLRGEGDGARLVDEWQRVLNVRLDDQVAGALAAFDKLPVRRVELVARLRREVNDLSGGRADLLGWLFGGPLRWAVHARIQAQRQTPYLDPHRQARIGGMLDDLDGLASAPIPVVVEQLPRLLAAIADEARREAVSRQSWRDLAASLSAALRAELAFDGACPANAAQAGQLSAAIRPLAGAWQSRQARIVQAARSAVALVRVLQSAGHSVALGNQMAQVAAGSEMPPVVPDAAIDQPELFADLSRLAALGRWVENAERAIEAQYAAIIEALAAQTGAALDQETRAALIRVLCSLETGSPDAIAGLLEVVNLLDARRTLFTGGRPTLGDLSWLIEDAHHRNVLTRAAARDDFTMLLNAPAERAAAIAAMAEAQGIISEHYRGCGELRLQLSGRLVERFQAFRRRVRTFPPELRHPSDVRADTGAIWNWLLEVHGTAPRDTQDGSAVAAWTVADAEAVARRLAWPELLTGA